MHSNETLDRLWEHIDKLYETTTDLITLQNNVVQNSTDQSESAEQSKTLLDQLNQLRENLIEGRNKAKQDALKKPSKIKELSIERLNVVEPDGTVRLVLCNTKYSPGHVFDGEYFGAEDGNRSAGLYFFDDEGNECGGLIYGGEQKEDGSVNAGVSLTFDQYRQDQVVALQCFEENKQRTAGLRILDRPDIPLNEWVKQSEAIHALPDGPEKDLKRKQFEAENLTSQRAFIGKVKNTSLLSLNDDQGRTRIRLSVAPEGTAKLEFLNEKGDTTHNFPQNE